MKWGDVNYVHHYWSCTVIFDSPALMRPQSYQGRIKCANAGDLPILLNFNGLDVMRPPDSATVVLDTPGRPPVDWATHRRTAERVDL